MALPRNPRRRRRLEDTVHALLIDACFQATHRMIAVTPYFVPDVSLETAMRLAARRGVQIDLCIPAKSNHILADFVRNRSLRALTKAGVAVHLLPYMNHAKAVVFDDSIALCGSCNLDSRSLLLCGAISAKACCSPWPTNFEVGRDLQGIPGSAAARA